MGERGRLCLGFEGYLGPNVLEQTRVVFLFLSTLLATNEIQKTRLEFDLESQL